jgi:hypothetical protein
METFIPLITPVATLILTWITKNATLPRYNVNRTLLVRAMAAVWAIIIAVVAGDAVDQSAVEMAVTAVIAFLGSLGLFHATKAS